MKLWMSAGLAVVMAAGAAGGRVCAQASALPSAQSSPTAEGENHGKVLLDDMVKALGGDAWLNRQDWKIEGRSASFYKGKPHDEVPQFEEYYRLHPFGERVVVITHFGVFIATNHSDIAEVWTADNGYEVTYKGAKALLPKDVEEYKRRQAHSLETVVLEWMKQPDIEVVYDGADTESRRLTDRVSVFTSKNDSVVLQLEAGTHLPLSITYKWRDPVFKDLNTDEVQFDDYHDVQGVNTPYTITRVHNGDMVGQRFVTKVAYNMSLPADLFDPSRPLTKSTKK